MTKQSQIPPFLRLLARSCGIATSYIDFRKKRVVLPADVLCQLIGDISGEKISPDSDPEAYKVIYNRLRQESLERILPLTIVAWNGKFPKFWAWLPEGTKNLICRIDPEKEGSSFEQEITIHALGKHRTYNGRNYIRARISFDAAIPYGYYSFHVSEKNGHTAESFLISTPKKLASSPKRWGAFAPVYALKGEHDQGIGGYTELLEAARTIKQQGGEFFGTLPLLPLAYESKNPEISPYSPASRLFWNEIYLDVTQLPGPYQASNHVDLPTKDGLIDYAACYAYKKEILLKASKSFFDAYPEGDEAYQEYINRNVKLKDYADFCARKHASSQYEDMVRFHLYTQYACHLQLTRIKAEVDAGLAAALYLDYTVGVAKDGFDAQRLSELFLKGYDVGAPPDKMFIQGQKWGFEPLHPRKLEESRYWYLRDCFHHYFQYSKIMRIDHVMGLYRLYCVPEGVEATQGTYIYYNLNAQIAVLCLEAWRHGATVVGEDLGIVPRRIKEAMESHKISRMWIAQFQMTNDLDASFKKIKPAMLACLNTHDMFPFASYMAVSDLEKLQEMGIMKESFFKKFKKEREKNLEGLRSLPNALLGAIEGMAASKAEMVMINLEDVWEETIPQNMPGTTNEHTNWRRQYPLMIKEWALLPVFQQATAILNRHRMVKS